MVCQTGIYVPLRLVGIHIFLKSLYVLDVELLCTLHALKKNRTCHPFSVQWFFLWKKVHLVNFVLYFKVLFHNNLINSCCISSSPTLFSLSFWKKKKILITYYIIKVASYTLWLCLVDALSFFLYIFVFSLCHADSPIAHMSFYFTLSWLFILTNKKFLYWVLHIVFVLCDSTCVTCRTTWWCAIKTPSYKMFLYLFYCSLLLDDYIHYFLKFKFLI